MTQILHIFRKDIRHLWIEICVSILALSGHIWKTLHEWGHTSPMSDFAFLNGLLTALVPVAWCVLIVRVIQDESLVGDRQFWLTRPYEWKKLLAAKAFFVFLFINVPLFIANVIFIEKSGFSASHHLRGLLGIQFSMVVALILTTACVSVVTSTMVQVLLWVLGLGIYLVAISSLSSLIPDSHIPTSTGNSDLYGMAAFGLICAGIVFWQYSQRKTWIARIVIFGFAVVVGGLVLIPTRQNEVAQGYPLISSGGQLPFSASPTPPKKPHAAPNEAPPNGKKIQLLVPIQFSNVAQGSVVAVVGSRATIHTRTGDQLTTEWANVYRDVWPGSWELSVPIEIDHDFFERTKFIPADLRITLAFSEYHEKNPRQIVPVAGEFPVDGVGICWLASAQTYYYDREILDCRSPIRDPQVLARYDTSMSTCSRLSNRIEIPPTINYAAYLNSDSGAPNPTIIPIATLSLFFSEPPIQDSHTYVPGVCPGTPVTLSTPAFIRNASTMVEIDGVDLDEYVPPPLEMRVRY